MTPPDEAIDPRRVRPSFVGVAVVAMFAALALAPLVASVPVPVCFFRTVTGRPCVFCGMTHALVYIGRGELHLAMVANPLWWVILPLFGFTAAAAITKRAQPGWFAIAIVLLATAARAWMRW